MPAKNASATIEESISSVLAIPLVSELIVIDDKSTDNTTCIVKGIDDRRIRMIGGEGRGVSAALNSGIMASTCNYVARCDADDLYPSDRFDWQLSWLENNIEYVAISGGFTTISPDGKSLIDLSCDGIGQDVTNILLDGEPVTTFCSWLTRRSALYEVGGAREWFFTAEDLDLMFRLASRGRVWHEPRVAYLYRLHEASIVHSQPNTHRQFYENSAKAFAKMRQRGYADALMQGAPPLPPSDTQIPPLSAAQQIRGHLVGAAWLAHAAGDRKTARITIVRALRLEPASLFLWKHFILIWFKRSRR